MIKIGILVGYYVIATDEGWPSYTFVIVCPMFFPFHFILTSVDCNLFVRSHGWYVMRHRGLFDPPFLSVV